MPPVEKFEFTRNWNSPSDFPTYEPDEVKVRADMQALPDELKTYLNEKMAPAVDEKVPGSRTVNGHPLTDDVKVKKEDVGLGKVDNTPDAEKPVSQPQQEALDAKADKTSVLQKDNTEPYTPTQPYHPSTKDYTDRAVAGAVMGQVPDGSITPVKLDRGYVENSGGNMTGPLQLSGDPTHDLHAATKGYVDQAVKNPAVLGRQRERTFDLMNSGRFW